VTEYLVVIENAKKEEEEEVEEEDAAARRPWMSLLPSTSRWARLLS
jgi:hypothetical protein